jgi:5-deoxy-glucuronate isomerase
MYYLNVLAGASDARSLGFSDDPAYGWIRGTWAAQAPDPRVPLVSLPEPVR